MSSVPSSINDVLAAYAAGREKAARVVAVVAEAYYRETNAAKREIWHPVMEVVERAAPGLVELVGTPGKPGFEIRLGGREFPKSYEADLKRAVEIVLSESPKRETRKVPAAASTAVPTGGLWARVVAAVRRIFSASA